MIEFFLNVDSVSESWLKGKYTKLADAPVARSSFIFQTVGSKSYAFGGSYAATLNNSMSVYDHETKQWSAVTQTNAPTPRCAMASCVLDGKIYIFGGQINGATVSTGASTAGSAVFDPSTNRWTGIANLPVAVQWAAACSMNGLIYISGGYTTGLNTQVRTVYEYNPTLNTYRALADLPQAVNGHGMVAINNTLFVFGGVSNGVVLERFLRFNPNTNVWLSIGSTPFKNTYSSYGVVNKHLLVFGGSQNNTTAFNFLEEYSPLTNRWVNHPTGAPARHSAALTIYNDKAYLLGGSPGANGTLLSDFWEIS